MSDFATNFTAARKRRPPPSKPDLTSLSVDEVRYRGLVARFGLALGQEYFAQGLTVGEAVKKARDAREEQQRIAEFDRKLELRKAGVNPNSSRAKHWSHAFAHNFKRAQNKSQ